MYICSSLGAQSYWSSPRSAKGSSLTANLGKRSPNIFMIGVMTSLALSGIDLSIMSMRGVRSVATALAGDPVSNKRGEFLNFDSNLEMVCASVRPYLDNKAKMQDGPSSL